MKPTENDIRIFNDSLDRCVANPRFMDIFYDKFITGSEDVATRFEGIDMSRQKRALKASLYTAMLAADGNQPALEHLRQISRRHRDMQVAAAHYDLWLECLIDSARECGGMVDAGAAVAWQRVLLIAINIMRADPETPAGEPRGGS